MGKFAPDHTNCMYEREPVRVGVGFQRGFMHEATGRIVRHDEPIELLADEIRCLAAQDDFGAAQMGFEFVEGGFDFPPFVIERRQVLGRRLLVIQDGRDQAIDRFGISNTIQTIFDDAHHNAIGLVSPVALAGIDAAEIRAVRQRLLTGQTHVLLDPPELISARVTGFAPKLVAEEIAV